jgi:hypothetical protein
MRVSVRGFAATPSQPYIPKVREEGLEARALIGSCTRG